MIEACLGVRHRDLAVTRAESGTWRLRHSFSLFGRVTATFETKRRVYELFYGWEPTWLDLSPIRRTSFSQHK
eukprot:8623654-Pyramimonas_sp.AAC.1